MSSFLPYPAERPQGGGLRWESGDTVLLTPLSVRQIVAGDATRVAVMLYVRSIYALWVGHSEHVDVNRGWLVPAGATLVLPTGAPVFGMNPETFASIEVCWLVLGAEVGK